MSDSEVRKLFEGCGWRPLFVDGDDLDTAVELTSPRSSSTPAMISSSHARLAPCSPHDDIRAVMNMMER
jgi:hypothetical protein